jgi:hypothetical protein
MHSSNYFNCIYPEQLHEHIPNKVFYINDRISYERLQEIITEYVEADCWAVTVNNEIIFCSFDNHFKSMRDIILDDIIRKQIIEEPHSSLLVNINRQVLMQL